MKTNVKQHNNSIDMFRLIAAIMVVQVHTDVFANLNEPLRYFFINIFPRVAVPFFFVVSGYFYIGKLMAGKKPFFHYIANILSVYILWSAIYIAFFYVRNVMIKGRQLEKFINNRLKNFFIYGTAGHLWYIPALIIAVLVVTIFYKLHLIKLLAIASLALYVLGVLSCSYYKIGIQIPQLQPLLENENLLWIRRHWFMGLPLFTMGYFLNLLKPKIEKMKKKTSSILLLVAIEVFLIEVVIIMLLEIWQSWTLTFGLYFLTAALMIFLLKHPAPKYAKTGYYCRCAANFTYYSHYMTVAIIELIQGEANVNHVYLLGMVLAVGIFGGLFIGLLNFKWLNKLVG